jgi:putative acetyltransferase
MSSGALTRRGHQSLSVGEEPFDAADSQRLIAELDAHLASRYLPEQRFGPNLKREHLEPGLGTFIVARLDGEAVGCGALRKLDASAGEVKRMYVSRWRRGAGIGKAILDRLTAHAFELGLRRLVLETGIHQQEAISLYRSAGFRQIPCWGEYQQSETSVCFEKDLSPR